MREVAPIKKNLKNKIKRRKKLKLDGVGSVDNRPFTDKLHHFVKKKKKKCDMSHMTCDT